MPYGSGADREMRYQVEPSTDFGELPGAWSGGTPFECEDYQVEGMQQSSIENLNMRQRPMGTREKVLSLANGAIAFKVPMHGRATGAAEGARATMTTPREPIVDFMQCAWGGVRLGFCTGLASGTAAAPVVDAADGAEYEPGDWGFFIDATTGEGEFRKIESLSTDTIAFYGGQTLSFTPAAADTLGAVIQLYPHSRVLVNPRHADHTTLSFLDFGDLADDARQALGTKLNLTSIEGLAPGEAGKLVFEGMVTQIDNDGVTPPAAGVPLENIPLATSTGNDTYVYVSPVGSPLAAVEAQGFTITPGIASQFIPGVNGLEGRHGYALVQASADAMMVEVTVDYDDAWMAAWHARTRYQVLLQVGSTAGEAYGWFFGECEITEDPQRTTTTDLATTTLKLRPLETTVATAATGSALERVRAKGEFLMSVAVA